MIPRIFSVSLVLVLVSAPGFAQSSGKAASPSGAAAVAAAASVPVIPKDPKDLMLRVAEVNGLRGIQIPWHIKANYQTFDADGKPKDQGVFEEWWAGPEKWKASYTSVHFNQTLYRNGQTRLVTGDEGWVAMPEQLVMNYLNNPMPPEAVIKKRKFSVVDQKIGPVALTCLRPETAPHAPSIPTVCLDGSSPVARIETYYGGLYVQFDNFILTNGHYVAKQISVDNSNLPIVDINVTTLEFPSKMTDADVAAPASARIAPHRPNDPGLTGGHRTQEVYTPRPATTRDDRGMVMLEVTITKSGDVGDVHVVSGPREFRDTAVRNVRTWKFTPYLLNGKPVEVRDWIDMLYDAMPVRGILVY